MGRKPLFRPGDFVYRANDASHAEDTGKLGPKWEGPYEVTEALGKGAYKLRDMDGRTLFDGPAPSSPVALLRFNPESTSATSASSEEPMLVASGMGAPPLYLAHCAEVWVLTHQYSQSLVAPAR
ncbi:hypothetical protein Tco_0346474, partial [Tanacetum coccineum]